MLEAMPEPAMRAWLYAAARNAIVDAKRREARFLSFSNEDALSACARPPDLNDRAAAEALLGKLPLELGRIIRMKYFEAMNASRIGLALGVPPATVRTRPRKALRIIDGSVDLKDLPLLEALEAIVVRGTATLPASAVQTFKKKGRAGD
ncbi:MAG: hypothetical protein LBF95_03840 [Treponema sp.]|jgi:DNA-directed RNA polymerase specialized sigma24 family protein|nr:hypothetical protein [Treponema sp.]